jgi:hypothetical protein
VLVKEIGDLRGILRIPGVGRCGHRGDNIAGSVVDRHGERAEARVEFLVDVGITLAANDIDRAAKARDAGNRVLGERQ